MKNEYFLKSTAANRHLPMRNFRGAREDALSAKLHSAKCTLPSVFCKLHWCLYKTGVVMENYKYIIKPILLPLVASRLYDKMAVSLR